MNIVIREHETLIQAVSARELYQFLEIRADFTHWMKRMLDYGFEENIDYLLHVKNDEQKSGRGGYNKVDYFLTSVIGQV